MSGLGIFESVFCNGCVSETVPQPFCNRSVTVPQPFPQPFRNRWLHRKPYKATFRGGGLSNIG